MTATFPGLPPIPQPPNDPTWWPLDPIAGWKSGSQLNIETTSDCGYLVLEEISGPVRAFAEPFADFGGKALPPNMAIGSDGFLYLLDISAPALKRFDSCACGFDVRPCLTGFGAGPREVSKNCGGIAIGGGNLFICDTGNARVSVWSQSELLLRAFWSPPSFAGLTTPWSPTAAACDSAGRVYVIDSANTSVHRFNRGGVWEKMIALPGSADAVQIDRCGNVCALSLAQSLVWVLDEKGVILATYTKPQQLTELCATPFTVSPDGTLDLSSFCRNAPRTAVFGLAGNLITNPSPIPPVVFSPTGTFLSMPLDSSISQCVWHRIIMCASVPQGASLQISTFTAEALIPFDQVLALPDQAWSTNLNVYQDATQSAWDGLIQGSAGRYLWLKLMLRSSGSNTPTVMRLRVEFPRISLRRYLPAVVGADPVSADFTDRFLSLFDTVFRSIESTIDNQARLFDPLSAPSTKGDDFLSWLGTWVGVSFDRNWPEDLRRRYLKEAVHLYSLRGTRIGLQRQILLVLGIDLSKFCYDNDERLKTGRCCIPPANCVPAAPKRCKWEPPQMILEHFALRRWMVLGSGGLGNEATLWGQSVINRSQLNANAQADVTQLITTPDPLRDPFLEYAYKYTVFIPARYGKSDVSKRILQNLLQSESPAYALYDVQYVEPAFRIGVQSMIGYDTVVGRYPTPGVTIGKSELGSDTVLSAPA